MTTDWKNFLLVILIIFCFGSPLGEIVGSYSNEEEAARYPADQVLLFLSYDNIFSSKP
jgi:hypothetical protein